ncbi:MFS transporter [Spirochaetia bacterium 38H-sp]|uniref:MFS transporter n=1 Tax=Rarispira pelagica TaxID=3141764 RepID=A0ABU9U9E5_9SPIR
MVDKRIMVSQKEIKRSMRYSLLSGVAFVFWFQVASPQSLFNVFVKNYLDAGASGLGLLIGLISVMGIFQIFAVPLFNMLRTPKWVWIIGHVLHRLNAFFLAAVAFWVSSGGDKTVGFNIILVVMAVSWVLTNLTGSGWWAWMAELFPENIRAEFFGKRSALSNIFNMLWYFAVSVSLDLVSSNSVYIFWGIVFVIGGIGGLVDILLHIPMPACEKEPVSDGFSFKGLSEPLRDSRYVSYLFVIGAILFAVNIAMPFLSPYIVSSDGIGAPNFWLGVQFVLMQITWVISSPLWGTVMDRFGRKPVVVMGVFARLVWVGYLIMNPSNYMLVIPIVSLLTGVFGPALWDGMQQFMLSLAPEKSRVSYVSWFWLVWGFASAIGSVSGGWISDFVDKNGFVIRGGGFNGFQVVLFLSLLVCAVALMVLMNIEEGRAKPVRYVLARLANPGVVRTYVNMGIIRSSSSSDRVLSALRSVTSERDSLLLDDVKERLSDPDESVRAEAAMALGRLKAYSAVDTLVAELLDEDSPIRLEAARALGAIGDARAVPALIKGLYSDRVDVQRACLSALADIGGDEAANTLMELIRNEEISESVKASGVSAASKLGVFEAAWEIVPMLFRTDNSVLRVQLAISLANLLGKPGEFYTLVTGNRQEEMRESFFASFISSCSDGLDRLGISAKKREHLTGLLSMAVQTFECHDYEKTAVLMYDFGRDFISELGRLRGISAMGLDKLSCKIDDRLSAWWWLIELCRENTYRPELLRLALLVAFYSIHAMEL